MGKVDFGGQTTLILGIKHRITTHTHTHREIITPAIQRTIFDIKV